MRQLSLETRGEPASVKSGSTLWKVCGVVLIGLTLLAPPSMAAPKKKKIAPSQNPIDLVWPAPPETPRVRFVRAIRNLEDVTGKYKPSWVERLTGKSLKRTQLRLVKPYGVAVDKRGRVFVADMAQRAVLVFDLREKKVTRWRGNAQFPLVLPSLLAFDDAGRLFVSDSFGAQVVVFDPTGRAIMAFGKQHLQRAAGVVVDSARNRIYVADVKRRQVLLFNLRTFQLEGTIGKGEGQASKEEGSFSAPTNLALDSDGNLYVADTWNQRVQVFDPQGNFSYTFGTAGIQPGNFIRPKGLALDSQGHLYVLDAEFNNFQILTKGGEPLLFVGSFGADPGQFVLPAGIAIDNEDRVYIVEQGFNHGGRLQIFQYISRPSEATQASADTKGGSN